MSLYVLSAGFYCANDLHDFTCTADFRRATHNQCMAFSAVQNCLKLFPCWEKMDKSVVGTVVGTSHGELGTTVNFLKDLSLSQIARPLLFQNSLHNATLGFLTKALSITGPGLTISNSEKSGEACIEAAHILTSSMVNYCLVVGVDGLVPEIDKAFRAMYLDPKNLGEGAGALLLANEKGWTEQGRLGSPLEKLETLSEPTRYDSQTIELVAKAFLKTRTNV